MLAAPYPCRQTIRRVVGDVQRLFQIVSKVSTERTARTFLTRNSHVLGNALIIVGSRYWPALEASWPNRRYRHCCASFAAAVT